MTGTTHPEHDEHDHEPTIQEIRYEYTPVLTSILQHLHASLLVTTYQAGKLLVLGTSAGQMRIGLLSYEQPMGVAIDRQRIAIGSRQQIHFLVAAHDTAPSIQPAGADDGCFVPRSSFYTGNIHGHESGRGASRWSVGG